VPAQQTDDAAGSAADRSGRLEVVATVSGSAGTPLLSVSLPWSPEGAGDTAGTLVVHATGEVDLESAPLLRAALLDAVDRHAMVCCDLSGVTFFSAAGISALVTVHRRATQAGSTLIIRGADGVTRRVLQIFGVDRLLGGR